MFISEPSALQEFAASELGLDSSQINFSSASAQYGETIFLVSNDFGYTAPENFSGTDIVTLNYTTTTGLSGTLEVPYLVVPTDNEFTDFSDGGDSRLVVRGDTRKTQREGGIISDKPIYYGFDNYITEEDILSSLTDTFGVAPRVDKINSIFLSPNGSSTSTRIDFEEVSDGVWKISSDDVGDSEYFAPFSPTNRSFLIEAEFVDDGLGSFTYVSRFLGQDAPEGYVQPEAPVTELTEAGTEGVDFWYDGQISENFDQDAFFYRGTAPLDQGGDSKFWFLFKNTDLTDELTGNGEYALVATRKDALDNGESLDSITGEYAISKSFVSPDGIRMYAGIDEASVQELSNFGAEDIEVYRYDIQNETVLLTDSREILGGRLSNEFDTIGSEYAGSLSDQFNNAYGDTLGL